MKFKDYKGALEHVNETLGEGIGIIGTPWHDKKSEHSFSFNVEGEKDVMTNLCTIFGLEPDVFMSPFNEATNGPGMERNRITTLHSSALIALLTFYGVCAHRPVTMNINGENVVFNRVKFEAQNIVLDTNDRPSCIDIALYSTKHDIMLLLESKFTEEIFSRGKISNVNDKYYEYLHRIENAISEFKVERVSEQLSISCERILDDSGHKYSMYVGGIKQMCAHYMGTICGPKDKSDEYAQKFAAAKNNGTLYLGTILMDSTSRLFNEREKPFIDAYKTLLAQTMGCLGRYADKACNIIAEPFTYQNVFGRGNRLGNAIDEKVFKFYDL